MMLLIHDGAVAAQASPGNPSEFDCPKVEGAMNVLSQTTDLASSCASDEDSARWALAWASRSWAFRSKTATASAPAGQRNGGSPWLASRTSASASFAGSPP